jgi:hypothetical protein
MAAQFANFCKFLKLAGFHGQEGPFRILYPLASAPTEISIKLGGEV